jgi:excinuclease ABC subunit B
LSRYPDSPFELFQPYLPTGDQPLKLSISGRRGQGRWSLKPVGGRLGQNLHPANVIAGWASSCLHEQTLAAAGDSGDFFFSRNAVSILSTDYHQPETCAANLRPVHWNSAVGDIEADAAVSDKKAMLEQRRGTIIVAIRRLRSTALAPRRTTQMRFIAVGDGWVTRCDCVIRMQYSRNDADFARGTFRCVAT